MNKNLVIRLLIVAAMFGTAIYLWWKLPDELPIHWNFEWQADNWWAKWINLLLIPLVVLAITILMPLVSKIDPKKKNYESFSKTWELIQYAIVISLAYFYYISIYATINETADISMLMMLGFWVLFIFIGNYMWKVKQNYFVWIKFPWTLENEEVWNKTHRFWWKMFMLWWLIFIINAFLQWQVVWVFLFVIILILVVPIIYSYNTYNKITNK